MKCEIDIIIDKKLRWQLKSMLLERGLSCKEWFVEFANDRTIVSFDADETEENFLKSIFDFLKQNTSARIVLPNGSRINPTKERFDEFYRIVTKYMCGE